MKRVADQSEQVLQALEKRIDADGLRRLLVDSRRDARAAELVALAIGFAFSGLFGVALAVLLRIGS